MWPGGLYLSALKCYEIAKSRQVFKAILLKSHNAHALTTWLLEISPLCFQAMATTTGTKKVTIEYKAPANMLD